MEIKFVGIGGAFDTDYVNSSAILTLNSKNYLIDCGHSVFPQLVQKGWAQKIDFVLITHLHDDHIGSIGSFGFYTHHVLGRKLKVLLPNHPNFQDKFRQLVSLFMVRFEDYLEISTIDNSSILSLETTNLHYKGMETFSYLFTDGDQWIAYSGDLGNPDFLFEQMIKKGINTSSILVFHDTSFTKNSAHAYYQDLIKWSKNFKIFSYHHNPEKNPSDNTLPLVYESHYFLR